MTKPLSFAIGFMSKDVFKQMLVDPKKTPSFAQNILAGSLSGIVSIAITYPMGYLKFRLLMDVGTNDNRMFKNARDCISQTIKHDGYSGLYRGLPASMLGIVAYRGMYFGIFDTFKSTTMNKDFFTMFLFAQITTITAGTFSYIFDTIRCRYA